MEAIKWVNAASECRKTRTLDVVNGQLNAALANLIGEDSGCES